MRGIYIDLFNDAKNEKEQDILGECHLTHSELHVALLRAGFWRAQLQNGSHLTLKKHSRAAGFRQACPSLFVKSGKIKLNR